jgi:hypothetical protein
LKADLDESRTLETRVAPTQDPRLPMPGTDLVRRYQGKDVVVRVREGGFEYSGSDPPFPEFRRAPGYRHAVERIRVFRAGRQAREEAWQPRIALRPCQS